MMHARFATCGNRLDVRQAHPYAIQREGRTVLIGAHNGMIYDAEESAAAYNRPYTVDSKELFELLADNELDTINQLNGYGVITWYVPGTNHIKLARLSDDSEIVAARLEQGGVVWASTHKILRQALKFADLDIKYTYKLDDIGRIYEIHQDEVRTSPRSGVKLAESYSRYSGYLWEDDPYFGLSRDEWIEAMIRDGGWE